MSGSVVMCLYGCGVVRMKWIHPNSRDHVVYKTRRLCTKMKGKESRQMTKEQVTKIEHDMSGDRQLDQTSAPTELVLACTTIIAHGLATTNALATSPTVFLNSPVVPLAVCNLSVIPLSSAACDSTASRRARPRTTMIGWKSDEVDERVDAPSSAAWSGVDEDISVNVTREPQEDACAETVRRDQRTWSAVCELMRVSVVGCA